MPTGGTSGTNKAHLCSHGNTFNWETNGGVVFRNDSKDLKMMKTQAQCIVGNRGGHSSITHAHRTQPVIVHMVYDV